MLTCMMQHNYYLLNLNIIVSNADKTMLLVDMNKWHNTCNIVVVHVT